MLGTKQFLTISIHLPSKKKRTVDVQFGNQQSSQANPRKMACMKSLWLSHLLTSPAQTSRCDGHHSDPSQNRSWHTWRGPAGHDMWRFSCLANQSQGFSAVYVKNIDQTPGFFSNGWFYPRNNRPKWGFKQQNWRIHQYSATVLKAEHIPSMILTSANDWWVGRIVETNDMD